MKEEQRGTEQHIWVAKEARHHAVVHEKSRRAPLCSSAELRWSENVGLFFHCYGHNSVNSLHLHVIDMDYIGPSFHSQEFKNLPLEEVLKVLQEDAWSAWEHDTFCKFTSSRCITVSSSPHGGTTETTKDVSGGLGSLGVIFSLRRTTDFLGCSRFQGEETD